MPIFGVVWLAAVGGSMVQIGFVLAPNQAAPDLMRLDPMQGLRRLFSLSSVVRLGMGIVKIRDRHGSRLLGVVWRQKQIVSAAATRRAPNRQIAGGHRDVDRDQDRRGIRGPGPAGYLYQRLKFEQDLRMTREEVREEMRNLQGDPQIISRRRAVHRQLVLNRLSKTVPKADVVITNPTELAVAIQYDADDDERADISWQKGRACWRSEFAGWRWKAECRSSNASRLPRQFTTMSISTARFPTRCMRAVAEVLAYVYQLKGKPLPKAG